MCVIWKCPDRNLAMTHVKRIKEKNENMENEKDNEKNILTSFHY